MYMNIYCIDDDKLFLEQLENRLIAYSIYENVDIHVETHTKIPDSIPTNIDAYFLDVKINEEKIFDFLSKVREQDIYVPIVMISNYDCYVYPSVKFHIFDFIRKKHLEQELTSTMKKLLRYIDVRNPAIVVKNKGEIIKIVLHQITYIEASSHFTVINLINGEKVEVKRGAYSIFKDQLKNFIRSHRSYYVNKNYILGVGANKVILLNNMEVPLGQKYKKDVERFFLYNIGEFEQ